MSYSLISSFGRLVGMYNSLFYKLKEPFSLLHLKAKKQIIEIAYIERQDTVWARDFLQIENETKMKDKRRKMKKKIKRKLNRAFNECI